MLPPTAPKAAFDETIALIDAGDLAAAEGRCRAALETYPRDVNMLALLGALLIKMNRAEEAATTLRAGHRAGADLCEAARRSRPVAGSTEPDAGSRCLYLEQATRLDPKLEDAWFALGKALAAAGPWGRGGRRVRELLRALARAALHGARRRASEGGPARRSRASLPPRAASQPAQRRRHEAARV